LTSLVIYGNDDLRLLSKSAYSVKTGIPTLRSTICMQYKIIIFEDESNIKIKKVDLTAPTNDNQ
jgi:hypothetical protein